MPGDRGVCLVLAAPSGAGKSTISAALRAGEPDLANSVSVTTRAPRAGERDGVDYHFRSQEAFDRLQREGAFLEWARVYGRSYATPRAPVEAALAAGRDVVFDIDWQGHRQLRAALPEDVVGVFILPPCVETLRARLRARRDDEAEIERRMRAAEAEIGHWPEFDHVVVNHTVEEAMADVRAVLRAARLAARRRLGLRRVFPTA